VPRSDAELVSGALAIDYELGSLVDCSRRFIAAEDTLDRVAANAFLEAMLVHARCLIGFIAKPPDERDIHRYDYVDGWELSDPAESVEAVTLFDEISKHLAHLSWERARVAPPATWQYELPRFVVKLFEEFLAEAGKAHHGKPWMPVFEAGVQAAQSQLPKVRLVGGGTTTGALMAPTITRLPPGLPDS
jgi:hypothetical protein